MIELPWRRRKSPRPPSPPEPAEPVATEQHSAIEQHLTIEQHWALYTWEGPKDEDPFPADLAAWMRLDAPYRSGCAATAEVALSWARYQLGQKWPHVGHQLVGVSLEETQEELRMRMKRDHEVVMDLETDHGLRWILGVLVAPLCLSPSECHSQIPRL